MIILPESFKLSVKNLKMRLATIEDAEFIVSLRSNSERTKFMITLDDDIKAQIKWLEDYKKRERVGNDYYFVFESDGKRIGVNRISHIDFNSLDAKTSSWIKVPSERIQSVKMFFLQKYVIFELLKLNSFYTDIHEKNKKVMSYYQEFEYPMPEKPNERNFLDIRVNKIDYFNSKENILKKYNINIEKIESSFKKD